MVPRDIRCVFAPTAQAASSVDRLDPQRARKYSERLLTTRGSPMRRRDLLTLRGGAAVSWPVAARAQQQKRIRRIGVLMAHPEGDPEFRDYVRAFRQALSEHG
jgi:hypothetical protein